MNNFIIYNSEPSLKSLQKSVVPPETLKEYFELISTSQKRFLQDKTMLLRGFRFPRTAYSQIAFKHITSETMRFTKFANSF